MELVDSKTSDITSLPAAPPRMPAPTLRIPLAAVVAASLTFFTFVKEGSTSLRPLIISLMILINASSGVAIREFSQEFIHITLKSLESSCSFASSSWA